MAYSLERESLGTKHGAVFFDGKEVADAKELTIDALEKMLPKFEIPEASTSFTIKVDKNISLGAFSRLLEEDLDWQGRLVVEWHELKFRMEKLSKFLDSDDVDKLPKGQFILMTHQLSTMETYEYILKRRMQLAGIDFERCKVVEK